MSACVDEIIKQIPKNVYGEERYNHIRMLPDNEKQIIMDDMILLKKLLISVYNWDRIILLKIFIPFCKSLSCMDFIDLLLIFGRSFYSVYRSWPSFGDDIKYVYQMVELTKNLVQIDSTNYHLLINLFDGIVSGYQEYDRISPYVFDLLKRNNIILSDDFIVSGKKFIETQYYYKFLLACIEHNKQYGILPKNTLIKYLEIDTYPKYDKSLMEQLLSHFKNVDPVDVEELMSIHKKKMRDHLIEHIDFDIDKLKRYAYRKIIRDADEFEANLKKLKAERKGSKKRKSYTVETKLEQEPNQINDSNLDKKALIIEIIGTKITNVKCESDNSWRRDDMFNLHCVKEVDVLLPIAPENYEHYSSLFYNDKFIRVYGRKHQIDILIWDLTNTLQPVNHYYIPIPMNKSENMESYFDENGNVRSLYFDNDPMIY